MAGIISSTGIGSGLDIQKIVSQLIKADRKPEETRISQKASRVQSELSGLSKLKGALSKFQSALDTLKTPSTFAAKTAQSSNTDLFTVSGESGAPAGHYSIQVNALAQAQKLSSGGYATDASVGAGTLTVSVDGESADIAIDSSNNTLAGIRDAINAAADNPGVTASIIHADDGAHLEIIANQTGVAKQASVSANGDAALQSFADGLNVAQAAQDASITVDGHAYTGASNTITDVIDGVTINLESADAGATGTLSIDVDKSTASNAIKQFVGSYNNFVKTVNALSSYDQDSGRAGVLIGDQTMMSVTNHVRRALGEMTGRPGDAIRSLGDLGIDFQLDGTYELDSDKLATALDTHFDQVTNMFGGENGYAVSLDDYLGGYLGSGGILDVRTDGLNDSLADIQDARADLDRRMSAEKDRLMKKFNALDTLVSQLRTTGDYLDRQFSALENANSSSS